MRRYLLRAFIALFAFAAGVAAATLFGGWLGLNSLTERHRAVHVSSQPRSCPSKQRLEAPLPPEPPLPPVVVPVPPNEGREMRFSVRLPDGTVRVIEMKAGEKVEEIK